MSHAATPADGSLTRREREVLGMLAEGHSAPEIAEALTLAISTVKFHLDNIYGKLGVNSKRQALTRARALGLLIDPAAHAAAPQPPRHNLPLQVTRFFGRSEEMQLMAELLAERRLVTLSGPGGVGKTRLALTYAEAHLDDFAQGTWLVELAPVFDAGRADQSVAAVLGIRDQPNQPLLHSVIDFLRDRQVLIVLDNCEHLLTASGALVGALLRGCPHVRVLATSREALGAPGESVFRVPPLPFPDPERLPAIPQLDTFPALRLLVDRAQARLPGYQLADHNAAALARICRRLDGLPLALEMAAARLDTLSAEQLDGRLGDALTVLVNGRRTESPRQQTLQATLDWSFALLSEPQRILLRRLCVFPGSASLEAVEAICSGEGLPGDQVLANLIDLVKQSMAVALRRAGQPTRFQLLETVRQFSVRKLAEAAEGGRLRERHRDYIVALAEAASPTHRYWDKDAAAEALLPELENVRQALETSFSDVQPADAGPRIVAAMMFLWPSHREGHAWAERALDWCQQHTSLLPTLHIALLCIASTYCALNEPQRSAELVERAVALCRDLGPSGQKWLMRSLRLLAWRYFRDLGELEPALKAMAEAETVFEALDADQFEQHEQTLYRAWLQAERASLDLEQGQIQAAHARVISAIQMFEQHGLAGIFQYADAHVCAGQVNLRLGDYSKAESHFAQSLEAAERERDHNGPNRKAAALRWLGYTASLQKAWREGMDYCKASILVAREWPDYNIIASNLIVIAAILAGNEQATGAATMAGAAFAILKRQHRQPRPDWDLTVLDELMPDWRSRPDQADISAAFAVGQAMSNDEAIDLAMQNLPG